MTKSKKLIQEDWSDPDDAPDLSTPEWRERFASAVVSRGRPILTHPKISTTIRLDADIVARFRAQGPRWQTRINEALREWLKRAG